MIPRKKSLYKNLVVDVELLNTLCCYGRECLNIYGGKYTIRHARKCDENRSAGMRPSVIAILVSYATSYNRQVMSVECVVQ